MLVEYDSCFCDILTEKLRGDN